jgi:hypothetical protein
VIFPGCNKPEPSFLPSFKGFCIEQGAVFVELAFLLRVFVVTLKGIVDD